MEWSNKGKEKEKVPSPSFRELIYFSLERLDGKAYDKTRHPNHGCFTCKRSQLYKWCLINKIEIRE